MTFLAESKAHDAPMAPAALVSTPPMPLPNLPVPLPRAAMHLIPPAPSPKYISATKLSMARVVMRDVSVMSKLPARVGVH